MSSGIPNSIAQAGRFPRILYFTAGAVPTEDDYKARERYLPNCAFRNSQAVSALPHSSLEECDAVAGPSIPPRYAAVYPDVSDFNEGRLLRMSDLGLASGLVTDPNNEAKRAARPPSQADSGMMQQGAVHTPGAVRQDGGGFVAPTPQAPGLPSHGAERAENPPPGGPTPASNPHGLPPGGVSASQAKAGTAPAVSTGTAARDPAGSGFTAPKPAKGDRKAGSANGDGKPVEPPPPPAPPAGGDGKGSGEGGSGEGGSGGGGGGSGA